MLSGRISGPAFFWGGGGGAEAAETTRNHSETILSRAEHSGNHAKEV